ncbi:MAG: carboxypeptidase regulatory-like domain-containing protein [Candidatus Aenigmarchaeota archaeon]|nr:carboxypeptidase regulatory-like domain-containing protein [Candidatus Aenigmarchaeota archaeon]
MPAIIINFIININVPPPPPPPPGGGEGWIEGLVRDEGGRAIDNANVINHTTGEHTQTNHLGYYRLPQDPREGLTPGHHLVACGATGFEDQEREIEVRPGRAANGNFTLHRRTGRTPAGQGVVYGQVWIKNAQGKDEPFIPQTERVPDWQQRNRIYAYPLTHTVLGWFGRILPDTRLNWPEAISEGHIDEHGRYSLSLFPGTYQLVCNITDPRRVQWPVADSRRDAAGNIIQPLPHHADPSSVYEPKTAMATVRAYQRTKHDFHFYPQGGSRIARGANTARNWIEQRWGAGITGNIHIIALLAIGVLISNYFHNTNFLLGFWSLVAYFLIPEPIQGRLQQELEEGHMQLQFRWRDLVMRGENREQFNNAWRWLLGNNNSQFTALRSFAKVMAIWFFSQGLLQSTFAFSNIMLLIVVFAGYYSFAIEYDTRRSGQVIESFFRFAFLGVYLIPWVVVARVFDSNVLGLIAFAFLAVPPFSRRDQQHESSIGSGLEPAMKVAFLICMIIALMYSGAMATFFPESQMFQTQTGWGLKGGLADTFFFFWFLTTLVGFFSPPQERPAAGFIMLFAATVIYALGPGTQEVGQGLLGPYFPAFYKGMIGTIKPVTQAFSGFGSAFGPALCLLTNPVACAQNITDGRWSQDSTTGIAGAYGVELEDFRMDDQIFTEQPFAITLKLNNLGSFDARHVDVSFAAGEDAATIEERESMWIRPFRSRQDTDNKRKRMNLAELGFGDRPDDPQGKEGLDCVEDSTGVPVLCRSTDRIDVMEKKDIQPIRFESNDEGIKCRAVTKYELYEKYLPFAAKVSYDYGISSSLDVEFLSDAEWRRKSQAEELTFQQKIPSTLSNSPVMLNIDTTPQPIREDVSFPIRMQLKTGPRGGTINRTYMINAEIPTELWKAKRYCTPSPSSETEIAQKGVTLVRWEESRILPSRTIACQFNGYKFPKGEKEKIGVQPTKSFLIKTNASYRFEKAEQTIGKLEWGGVACCYPAGQYKGQDGDKFCQSLGYPACDATTHQCKAEAQTWGPADHCKNQIASNPKEKCNLGAGGCSSDAECCSDPADCQGSGGLFDVDSDGNPDSLECRRKIANGVCCPAKTSDNDCAAAHQMFTENKSPAEVSDFLRKNTGP